MEERRMTVGMCHQAQIICDHRYLFTYLSEETREKAISEAKANLMLFMDTQDDEEVEKLIASYRVKAKTIRVGGQVVDTYPQEATK